MLRLDEYSVGVIIYFMMMRQFPFKHAPSKSSKDVYQQLMS